MATISRLLALSTLLAAALAHAQFVTAQGTYQIFDSDLNIVEARYDSHQEIVGPALVDHDETYLSGASTFLGTARISADYGTLRLYTRARVDHRNEAAYINETKAQALFFDPLTIDGGTAGDSMTATMHLDGTVDSSTLMGLGYGYGLEVNFYVYDEVSTNWLYAPDQTSTSTFGTGVIDLTTTVTLKNYDPTRRYALYGYTEIAASPGGGSNYTDESIDVIVDAEHTATLTGIGFTRGSAGTFTGASGHVYPQAVPEPIVLPALAVPLCLGLRRKRRNPDASPVKPR